MEEQGLSAAAAAAVKSESIIRSVEHGSGIMAGRVRLSCAAVSSSPIFCYYI